MLDRSQFTEPQAARILAIHQKTLAGWRRKGAIGFHKTPGGRIFYTADQLAKCRDGMRVEPVLG